MRERENMKISNSRKSSYINRVASIFLFLSLLSPFAATAGITIASSYTTNETMTIKDYVYIGGKDTVLTVAVLAIVITAPLGAFAIDLTYKKLLSHGAN